TAFPAHLPDVHPRPLMDEDLAVTCPLVRPGLPRIRFLFVRSRFWSTLLSDAASRRRPCASLALHLHPVVQGTCTPKLSNMLGTQVSRCRGSLALAGPLPLLGSLTNVPTSTSIVPISPRSQGARRHFVTSSEANPVSRRKKAPKRFPFSGARARTRE